MPPLDDAALRACLDGAGADEAAQCLPDSQIKMLNLGAAWLGSLLPHCLHKVNRVHYGLLRPHEIARMSALNTLPRSRRYLAVPFVGKDAPSAASFANMLEPLRTIVRTSTPVNKALGQIQPGQGCSPFVRSLVGRLEHRSAIVRRMLLEILTSIYEKHASPKQLVEKHRLKPVLANIKEHDPVVIPREIARNLYSSFQIHDIL